MLNIVKVNTNAALFDSPSKYSHALVVRDHAGSLVEAIANCCQESVTLDFAEAIGIREALSWVKKERQCDVVVETDCFAMVQWIRNSYTTLSYLGRIVDECKILLIGLQNQNLMLRFVKRSANHYNKSRFLRRQTYDENIGCAELTTNFQTVVNSYDGN